MRDRARQYVSGQMSRRFLLLIILTQAAAFVGVWFAGYRRLPDEVSMGALGDVVMTWGFAEALFFTLLGLRHLHMPAVLCFLGRISYSIYILHVLVIQVVGNMHIPIWLKFFGGITLTIGLSTAT